MAALQQGWASIRTMSASSGSRPRKALATIVLLGVCFGPTNESTSAAGPQSGLTQATTSNKARQAAVRAIPVEKLSEKARAKVATVLSGVSVFRRMPIRVVDCNPNLYLFLLRHPDVVTNIWEVLNMSQMKVSQVGDRKYHISDAHGTLATAEVIYGNHDTHIVYAEGTYEGPLLGQPIRGCCILVLKSGYVRETNGRYYITTRLDTFIRVEPGGAELLTKVVHPLIGKTADTNFLQTVAFLGSLSRTAEVNSRGVQRLAGKLSNVAPETRRQLAKLAADIGDKANPQSASAAKTSDPKLVASRPSNESKP